MLEHLGLTPDEELTEELKGPLKKVIPGNVFDGLFIAKVDAEKKPEKKEQE